MSTDQPSKLTVIGQGSRRSLLLCRCECGTVKEFPVKVINRGRLSCGCLRQKLYAIPDGIQSEIVELYATKVSMTKLANKFGRPINTIRRVLNAHKVKIRTAEETPPNTHQLDELAFERDDRESRYWLGFILTDGSVSVPIDGRGGYVVRVGLGIGDISHIESFRSFLRGTHKIHIREPYASTKPDGTPIRSAGAATMHVNSRPLVESLTALGVRPDKSQTAVAPPHLADDVDFWRGVIDGDGWVFTCEGKKGGSRGRKPLPLRPFMGVCGTKAIVEGFNDFVLRRVGPPARKSRYPVRPNASIWRVDITGYQAVRLAEFLYADAPLALPRKKAVADKIRAMLPFVESITSR